MKKYRLIFFLLISLKIPVFSQGCLSYVPRQNIEVTSDLICPDLLLEDLQFLHERLLAAHPNLFLYTSPQLFDSAYSDAVLLCSKPQTLYSFTMIVSRFLTAIKDSHTSINCMELFQYNRRQRYYFPITLKTIENKLYITKNYKDLLPVGAELIAFDNINLKQCVAESELLSPIEANATSAQKEVADILLGRILNIKSSSESHSITYVSDKNDTINIKVKSPKYKRINEDGEWPNVKKSVEFTIDKERATLSISTFFPIFEHGFKRQLDQAFSEIILRKPSELIIDLRSNSGGFILLISYVLLNALVLLHIWRGLRTFKKFDLVFVSLAATWLCYQAQSIISINQIGIAIWGWILNGAVIAYEKITRSAANQPEISKTKRENRVRTENQIISPQLIFQRCLSCMSEMMRLLNMLSAQNCNPYDLPISFERDR